jgi:xanthine dehydrogenase accessory factor
MSDVLATAARLGASGEATALVTVLQAHGSTPRGPGAKMVVPADGAVVGTVGGGRMEHEVTPLAREVARRGEGLQRWKRHLAEDLGMCCGGQMELLVEPIDRGRAAVLADVVESLERRRAVAVETRLDGAGGKAMLPDHDCLRLRRPRLDEPTFVEPELPAPRLVLFGGGHIAAATAPFAGGVGFEVVVCDEDDAFASEERFPGATALSTFDVAEVEQAIGVLGASDYVVLATRDHAVDQALLERLLDRMELSFLGMVGSRGKRARFQKRLGAKGIGTPESWARLRSPVGLDIGAETPQEIALAIVAELTVARARERGWSPRP